MANKKVSALQTALETHPDKKSITIGGRDFDFLPGVYGFKLAKKEGLEVDLTKASEGDPIAVADYVYSGLLPFDPDITRDEFDASLSIKELTQLGQMISEDMLEDDEEAGESTELPEGK